MSPTQLSTHVAEAHSKPPGAPKCKFCTSSEAYDSGDLVWEHCLGEHRVQALKNRFLCTTCGSPYTSLAAYYDHQVSITSSFYKATLK